MTINETWLRQFTSESTWQSIEYIIGDKQTTNSATWRKEESSTASIYGVIRAFEGQNCVNDKMMIEFYFELLSLNFLFEF